jgi:hypothetical protein
LKRYFLSEPATQELNISASNLSILRALKKFKVFKAIFRFRFGGTLAAVFFASSSLSSEIPVPEPAEQQFLSNNPIIFKLKPEREDGRGYKLVYLVDAPLDVFWKFKTDFDNQFLLSNKFITSHRLVSRDRNVVVTETEYSNKPKVIFKWQTTLLPDQHLLKFKLLNPEESGQKYHYGHIQLEALGSRTRVTQVAYFNFFGVSIWVSYPFYGGMSYFLKYTATWEQHTISHLKGEYQE